ncbi:MAG: beta-N-acetylhexosaminidase [Bacilli bacterium]
MFNSFRLSMVMILYISLLIGCNINPPQQGTEKPERREENVSQPKIPTEKEEDPILKQIETMTLDQKIGQMVLVGFEGTVVNDHIRELIDDYNIGGVIFYKQNISGTDQAIILLNSVKEINSDNTIPLFLSVDEEGGRVTRMPNEFTRLPTNEEIGRINNEDFSQRIGQILGKELKAFGFNMDYAPVLDINNNPNNPVIGDRSFGPIPELVSKLAISTMKGIGSQHVIPVVKHFPGHGDTSVDSHKELPVVNKSMEELQSFELIPFKEALENGAEVVMIAHILLPQIDTKYPASMSKSVITDLLRGSMKFDGVVITDDMTMGAILKNYDISEAAVQSVSAGSDIILVAHDFDTEVQVIQALKKSVEDGRIPEKMIDQSVYRILKLKKKYALTNETIKNVDVKSINLEISRLLEEYTQ